MHKVGVIALIIGALLTIIGLAAGFGFMFAGYDEQAKIFLALVPLGFVVGFVGIVTTLLYPTTEVRNRVEPP
jgi:hypothetical protein